MIPISEIIIAVVTAIILTPLGLFLRSLLSRTKYLDDKLEKYKKETDHKIGETDHRIQKISEQYYTRDEFEKKRELINEEIKDLRKEIKEDMNSFREDIKADMSGFRTDIKENHKALINILLNNGNPNFKV